MLIDTHCHLDDPLLGMQLPAVMERCRRTGVFRIIVPGIAPSGWEAIDALARVTKGVSPAFGVHPQHAEEFSDDVGGDLEHRLGGAVATGEIGLDYTLPVPGREVQKRVFREQLRLAVNHGVPVLLHCRKAFSDLLKILKEEKVEAVGGVMHAYSGSVETAAECLRLGLYISVGGPVTYANAVKTPEVVRHVPFERLLLETDAPDMPPEPYRGQVNEPAHLVLIAEKVALLKGVTFAEAAERTTMNAERLFRFR